MEISRDDRLSVLLLAGQARFQSRRIERIWIVFASFFHRDTDRPTARFFRDSCAWYQRVRKDNSTEGSVFAVTLVTYFSGHGEPAECSCSWKIRGTGAWKIRAISSRREHPPPVHKNRSGRFESFFCILRNGFFLLVYGYRKRNCENR